VGFHTRKDGRKYKVRNNSSKSQIITPSDPEYHYVVNLVRQEKYKQKQRFKEQKELKTLLKKEKEKLYSLRQKRKKEHRSRLKSYEIRRSLAIIKNEQRQLTGLALDRVSPEFIRSKRFGGERRRGGRGYGLRVIPALVK